MVDVDKCEDSVNVKTQYLLSKPGSYQITVSSKFVQVHLTLSTHVRILEPLPPNYVPKTPKIVHRFQKSMLFNDHLIDYTHRSTCLLFPTMCRPNWSSDHQNDCTFSNI